MTRLHLFVCAGLCLGACGPSSKVDTASDTTKVQIDSASSGDRSTTKSTSSTNTTAIPDPAFAHVESVTVTKDDGRYTFAVTVRSGDEGCHAYADWWEVLSSDGELLYRRILNHSHVDEQPFTRSGGALPLSPEQVVLVRAHRHPTGYGGVAMEGRPRGPFEAVTLEASFASELETMEPLPEDCWY